MDYDYINELTKPKLQPPPVVFKIVWPILYILMFWSFYLFLNADCRSHYLKIAGFWIFITQLVLNYMWSPLFFYYKKIKLALVVAVLLTIAVGTMVICFYKVSKPAGLLNIPYFLWMLFADWLNYQICILNRDKCIL